MARRARAVFTRSYPWTDLDPERRNTLLLYAGISGIVAFALLLIAVGYYTDKIAPKNDTVLEVGDRKFSYALLERRIKYDLSQNLFSGETDIRQAVIQTLQRIELEEVTKQAATKTGLTATDEEIDDNIRTKVGLGTDPLRDIFAAFYRQDVLRSGLPVSEYRGLIEAQILERKLRKHFEDQIPAEVESADLRIILSRTREDAQKAKDRLADTSFALVAASASVDEVSKANGGELGWVPRGALTKEAEDVVFSIELNQVSEITEVPDGFVLVQTRAREVRPLDENQRQQITSRSVDNLLRSTREEVGSTPAITEDQIGKIATTLVGR